MPTKNEIEVFLRMDSLKLKEEIEEIYIYQDNIKSKYEIFYNDEIKFPFNIEKGFYKKFGKIKNFFEFIADIEVKFSKEENLIKIIYTTKDGF